MQSPKHQKLRLRLLCGYPLSSTFFEALHFNLRAPSNVVIGNCLAGMLSVREWATRKLVGAQATFPRSISSISYFSNPTTIDYAKDRLFPLKALWETVDKIPMVDPIWLVGSFKSLASKGLPTSIRADTCGQTPNAECAYNALWRTG